MRYADIQRHVRQGTRFACALCASEAVDPVHVEDRGMGGRAQKKADDDAFPGCRACHSAHHVLGELTWRRANDGELVFCATGETAKRLHVHPDLWNVARYEGADLDEITEEER